MNIASALMFLGFRTILGTKWYVSSFLSWLLTIIINSSLRTVRPMADKDGPFVANIVYNALFNQQLAPQALEQISP